MGFVYMALLTFIFVWARRNFHPKRTTHGWFLHHLVRFLAIVLPLILALGVVSASAFSVEARFSNCEKLRSSNTASLGSINGVARDSRSAGITGAYVDPRLYEENKHLDTDNDGVACELFMYDSGVTKTSAGVASMYAACKTYRQADLNGGYAGYLDYPYYNERDQLLYLKLGAEGTLPLVRTAAKANPVFASAVKAAERDIKISQTLWRYWPKEPWVPAPDFTFDNWCSYFGMYESHPGLFPPIKWNPPKLTITALYGARGVCKKLFWESPDQVMYSGYDSISLRECDREASWVSQSAFDYDDAKELMLDYLFNFRDYWCWGKNCLTRHDF